jgi:putative ABC transport system permease protein
MVGLATGVAVFWVIALYVIDERSYDRYHQNADRIFRVAQHGKWSGGTFNLAVTAVPYAAALKADFPEVEESVKIDAEGGAKIIYGDKQINAPDLLLTDNSFFKIFSYRFLSGDSKSALASPRSIVLTKTLAEKIFGSSADALNKTVDLDGTLQKVTGVIEDVPANSHFIFSGLRSFDNNYTGEWNNAGVFTYVLLKNAGDDKKIESRGDLFFSRHLKDAMKNVQYRMELQPLTSIHLHSHLDYEIGNNGNIVYVNVFTIVALLILGIAIINYVNLTTARSTVRMKEIGVRKVIGSSWNQLMLLFICESVLLAVFATALGLFMAKLSLPFFNEVSGKAMDIWQFGWQRSLGIFAAFALIAGMVSGIYPALFMSGFKAIPAIKGQISNRSSTLLFRKSLVIFQFVVTIVMIAGSFVMYRQLHYVMNKDLGFNKSGMLTFHVNSFAARQKIESIKQEMLKSPLIESVAAAGNPIGNNDLGSRDFNIGADGNAAPDTKMVQALVVDEDFLPAMQLRLTAGRNFMKQSADSANGAIIVNETLIKELGWTNPVGRRVRTGTNNGVITYSTIVGVVKDFNTYSLQHRIMPVVLRLASGRTDLDNLYVRVSAKNVQAALTQMQSTYAKFDLDDKAEYHFLDQNFANQYQTEQKQGLLLLVFTALAILIACLGLFGLVTFTAEQRVKEIGIRKVLGASVTHIVGMLNRELMQLVILATFIATPLAWYVMSRWLDNFAYRIDIRWWIFATAGGVAVLIAFITVTLRSIKAATANPVKNLRSE